jgi:NAD(P)-dependent dehydrogenase (short-subunit alcohol dehydrogenase family)
MPIAIVTGSDSGIGKASAVAFARAGYDFGTTWNTDKDGARETAEQVEAAGRRAEVRHLDLTQPESGAAVVDALADALGGLDVFVNNAGTGHSEPFLDHAVADWRRVLDVDLTGPFVCAQRAAQRMVTAGRGGRIINVTSVHEHVPLRGSAAYCAAKGGLGLLTKVMALELAEHGITVNAVAPGEISTPMTGQEDVDPGQQHRPGVPAGRPGDAREVAGLVVFLASDEARYITGASYLIDGGMLLMAAEANRLAADAGG